MTIRYKTPDKKNAASIVESARRNIEFTFSIKIAENSGPTIIRNIYESFRMLGDALLVRKGITSKDHQEPIKELLKLDIRTDRPIAVIENLRRLRHNINYYGYNPNILEVNEAISIGKKFFNLIYKEVIKKIGE